MIEFYMDIRVDLKTVFRTDHFLGSWRSSHYGKGCKYWRDEGAKLK